MSVDFDVRSRLGRFVLTLSNVEESFRGDGVEVLGDVSIQYGELKSDGEQKPVLKSTMQVTFLDRFGRLSEQVERRSIRARLTGPGVDWRGRITPRRTQSPLNYRTRPGELKLAFYDGIADAEDVSSVLARDYNASGAAPISYAGVLASLGDVVRVGQTISDDTTGTRIASDVQYEYEQRSNTFTVSDLAELQAERPYEAESLLDDVRHVCAATRTRVFQHLRAGRVVAIPARHPASVQTAVQYYTQPNSDPYRLPLLETVESSIPLFEEEVRVLDDESGAGFHPFSNSGSVTYDVGQGYDLARNSDFFREIDGPDADDDYTTIFSGWESTGQDVGPIDDNFGTLEVAEEDEPRNEDGSTPTGLGLGVEVIEGSSNPITLQLQYTDTVATVTQEVGHFDPVDTTAGAVPGAALLRFDAYRLFDYSNRQLEVRLRYVPDDGSPERIASTTFLDDGTAELMLEFEGQAGTLHIEVEGKGAAYYQRWLRVLDATATGDPVEELLYREVDFDGTWDVASNGGTVERGTWPVDLYTDTHLGESLRIPYSFNAADRLRRRPRRGKTLRTRVPGLHGPETRLRINNPNTREEEVYYCGVGRKINVSQGWTEIADSQLPENLL